MKEHSATAKDFLLEESMESLQGFLSLKMIGGVENSKKNLSKMTINYFNLG